MAQATKQVRELFNLPKDENIFDDFSCSLNGMPGRLYLSQNYLCFFSTLLGRTAKHILKFQDISKLTKANSRLQKLIKIHKVVPNDLPQDKKKKPEKVKPDPQSADQKVEMFKFYGFRDRDMTFKYIKRLWGHASPYADEEDSDSNNSDELEDEVPATIQHKQSMLQPSDTSQDQNEFMFNGEGRRKTSVII